jgi:hypothetical protein
MATILRRLNPSHWIYLAVHAIVLAAGITFAQVEDLFWQGVGASLVAAALAGWTIFVYVLFSQRTSDRLRLLAQFGLRSAFPARQVRIKDQFDSRLKNARWGIDILGFGLNALRQDYGADFRHWAERCPVRILILDPDYPNSQFSYANQRDAEEENPVGSIASHVADMKRITHQFRHAEDLEYTGTLFPFRVRLYTCLPSVSIFRIDDEIFWGPYFVKDQSRNMPTLLVNRGGVLYERLSQHFEDIWNDSNLSKRIDP